MQDAIYQPPQFRIHSAGTGCVRHTVETTIMTPMTHRPNDASKTGYECHNPGYGDFSSRTSQARAATQWRLTVALDRCMAWAVSSIERPAKKRSSTTRDWTGSIEAS